MSALNHVTGGVVVTGLFSSLFNVNIFDSPIKIFTVVLGSLLPDIDHPKSLIGIIFKPISECINRRFGHRTFTHSLFFLFFLTLFVRVIEIVFFKSTYYAWLLSLSYFVHLALDMVTIDGVPLFYPFTNRRCVMPGNNSARITSGNFKQEFFAFFIFCITGFFLAPLYENGFWLSFNSAIGSVRQVKNQFYKEDNLLFVEYSVSGENGRHSGSGYLLAVSPNVIIYESGRFVKIPEDLAGKFSIKRTLISKKLEDFTLEVKDDITLKNLSSINVMSQNSLFFICDGVASQGSHFEKRYVNDISIKIPARREALLRLSNLELELDALKKNEIKELEKQRVLKLELVEKKELFKKASVLDKIDLREQIKQISSQIRDHDFCKEKQSIISKMLLLKREIDDIVVYISYSKVCI